jgi:hypothetical protein
LAKWNIIDTFGGDQLFRCQVTTYASGCQLKMPCQLSSNFMAATNAFKQSTAAIRYNHYYQT